ncbi:PAAR-like domain-containing protein [Hyalangium versicolor]|uniref:PAAR-like domain-containing protein n=1 Tax=Hyalangium versicolor TaxID=2861190 RepID=UPI001CCC2E63|nr:PAAR-like domain-containing protein [Hyalangium versicolor]
MQTHVYANGREICSKAADGKSTAAFPDVCWSPPAPPAGPIQLPYPNTAFASDLENGTSTVFICGAIVARKDESYLSTSTGDEPATDQFPMGISTGVLQGKAYFTSWSMNVMVEGVNVARHQDLMTHNHASPGGNTPAKVYFDDAAKSVTQKCKSELDKIDKECGEEPKHNEPTVGKTKKSALKKLAERLKSIKGKGERKAADDNNWMDHCDGLWVKPATLYSKQISEFAQQIEKIQGDLLSEVSKVVKPLVEQLEQSVLDGIKEAAKDRATKLGLRSAARWGAGLGGAAVGGVGAIVTEAVATAWNVYDMASTGYEGYKLGKDALAKLDTIKETMGDFDNALGDLKGALDKAKSNPQAAMAQAMSALARLNPCTRARRCILVPYKNTFTLTSLGGHGCCPGQTGHHVLPHEMTKDGNCPGYSKREAPTLCVEGVNNSHGSHGKIHDVLVDKVKDHRKAFLGGGDTMTYTQARNMGVESISKTFGLPGEKCDENCLKAQLDAYYEKKCTKPLPAVAGKAIPAEEEAADDASMI